MHLGDPQRLKVFFGDCAMLQRQVSGMYLLEGLECGRLVCPFHQAPQPGLPEGARVASHVTYRHP